MPAPLLLLQNVWQQLLGKSTTNKFGLNSTTNTLLENQIFIDIFLVEGCEYAALQKKLAIAPFIESFKVTNLGKYYLQILLVLGTTCLSIAFC